MLCYTLTINHLIESGVCWREYQVEEVGGQLRRKLLQQQQYQLQIWSRKLTPTLPSLTFLLFYYFYIIFFFREALHPYLFLISSSFLWGCYWCMRGCTCHLAWPVDPSCPDWVVITPPKKSSGCRPHLISGGFEGGSTSGSKNIDFRRALGHSDTSSIC